MAKKIIFSTAIMIFLFSAFVEAACINPTDAMVIEKSTILCAGKYVLPSGISIGKSDIILDCNGATLEGTLENSGIYVKGYDGIVIKNCIIEGYDYGIYLEDSFDNEIVNSEISNSGIGIYMLGAYAKNRGTVLFNNEQDSVNFTTPSEPEEERKAKPKVEVRLPSVFTFDNYVQESLVDELGIRQGYEKAKDIVSIKHKRVDRGNELEFSIIVTPKWEVIGLEIYEHIPKALVESASLITSDTEFEIIKDDPDIVFKLGRVKAGEEKVIVYKIGKPELTNINPSSIASIEKAINPTDSIIIRLLFTIAMIMIIINKFLNREIYRSR